MLIGLNCAQVVLPAPLRWYYRGFVKNWNELPNRLLTLVDPSQKSAIQIAKAQSKVFTCAEFDWNMKFKFA